MLPFARRPLTLLTLLLAATAAHAADPAPIKIALAGDSTVTDNAGWAKGFEAHLAPNFSVSNFARGGRASGSFVKEGLWKKTLDSHPDYVLIQFGHNDQPGHGKDRETDPATTYRQNMTFYVDDARAHHIAPILVTSLSRRQWGPDGKIHSTLTPYVDVVKQIAAEKNVPLLDLHARSIELYEKLGKDGCNDISPLKDAPAATASTKPARKDDETIADTKTAGKVFDGTHLNPKGSDLIGALVADELKKAVPTLAPYIK